MLHHCVGQYFIWLIHPLEVLAVREEIYEIPMMMSNDTLRRTCPSEYNLRTAGNDQRSYIHVPKLQSGVSY